MGTPTCLSEGLLPVGIQQLLLALAVQRKEKAISPILELRAGPAANKLCLTSIYRVYPNVSCQGIFKECFLVVFENKESNQKDPKCDFHGFTAASALDLITQTSAKPGCQKPKTGLSVEDSIGATASASRCRMAAKCPKHSPDSVQKKCPSLMHQPEALNIERTMEIKMKSLQHSQ